MCVGSCLNWPPKSMAGSLRSAKRQVRAAGYERNDHVPSSFLSVADAAEVVI